MNIYLNASQTNNQLWPIINQEPVALIKLADKYLIEYLLESCKDAGINQLTIVGGQFYELLEKELGYGVKWGIQLTYKEKLPEAKNNIIINVDSLYDMPFNDLITACKNNLVSGNTHYSLELSQHIFKIFDYFSYYFTCMKLVGGELKYNTIDFHQSGYRVIEGERVQYNPDSIKDGYLSIGNQSKISPTTSISDNVIIGNNVIVDDYAQLSRCIILENTYVGKMLKVDYSIITGNYLLSMKNDSCTNISDDIIIDNLKKNETYFNSFMKKPERAEIFA